MLASTHCRHETYRCGFRCEKIEVLACPCRLNVPVCHNEGLGHADVRGCIVDRNRVRCYQALTSVRSVDEATRKMISTSINVVMPGRRSESPFAPAQISIQKSASRTQGNTN